jgi:hypothetical protein
MTYRLILLAAAVLQFTIHPSAAWAAPIHETFIYSGSPSTEKVAEWSALPGSRSYLLQMDSPAAWDLDAVAQLRGADRIQIEVKSFIGEDAVESWKKVAQKGIELVGFNRGIPSEDEADRLNRIGFARYTFVLAGYPGPEEAHRLARLQAPVSLTIVTHAYPRFEDRAGLLAVPASVPLLHSTDYWPWYTHMDLMNQLPQAERLRVKDMFPPEEELPYLKNIKKLDEVIVDTNFDAPAGLWEKLGAMTVRWSSRDRVPYEDGLAAFEASRQIGGLRKLTIDSDTPLTDSERRRLEASPLPVEWIHVVY